MSDTKQAWLLRVLGLDVAAYAPTEIAGGAAATAPSTARSSAYEQETGLEVGPVRPASVTAEQPSSYVTSLQFMPDGGEIPSPGVPPGESVPYLGNVMADAPVGDRDEAPLMPAVSVAPARHPPGPPPPTSGMGAARLDANRRTAVELRALAKRVDASNDAARSDAAADARRRTSRESVLGIIRDLMDDTISEVEAKHGAEGGVGAFIQAVTEARDRLHMVDDVRDADALRLPRGGAYQSEIDELVGRCAPCFSQLDVLRENERTAAFGKSDRREQRRRLGLGLDEFVKDTGNIPTGLDGVVKRLRASLDHPEEPLVLDDLDATAATGVVPQPVAWDDAAEDGRVAEAAAAAVRQASQRDWLERDDADKDAEKAAYDADLLSYDQRSLEDTLEDRARFIENWTERVPEGPARQREQAWAETFIARVAERLDAVRKAGTPPAETAGLGLPTIDDVASESSLAADQAQWRDSVRRQNAEMVLAAARNRCEASLPHLNWPALKATVDGADGLVARWMAHVPDGPNRAEERQWVEGYVARVSELFRKSPPGTPDPRGTTTIPPLSIDEDATGFGFAMGAVVDAMGDYWSRSIALQAARDRKKAGIIAGAKRVVMGVRELLAGELTDGTGTLRPDREWKAREALSRVEAIMFDVATNRDFAPRPDIEPELLAIAIAPFNLPVGEDLRQASVGTLRALATMRGAAIGSDPESAAWDSIMDADGDLHSRLRDPLLRQVSNLVSWSVPYEKFRRKVEQLLQGPVSNFGSVSRAEFEAVSNLRPPRS